ncbi:MAG: outer membrane protein assembly factor BamA [Deltaproteobacteria bacterium]|nr:outer membrane protein assembly factor BamA [Deltaproteobacteria bacterium]
MLAATVCCLAAWNGLAAGASVVNEVRVQGNLRVEEDAVRLSIQAQTGGPFDQAVVDRDVKAIYRMGFFDDVSADFSAEGILTYTVKERPYVKDVEILGNDKVSTEDIEAALGIRQRTALDAGRLQEGLQRVLRLYSEAGHVNTRVDYILTPAENNQTTVTLTVVEGKTLLIRKITFEGNREFPDDELKDNMNTKEAWLIPFTSRGRLDPDVLTNDTTLLSSLYYDHGFVDHKIDEPIILTRDEGLEVVIRIQEGQRYRVGVVRVGGDLGSAPNRLLDDVTLTSGQVFRRSRLLNDVTALQQRYADRGYAFADVSPDTRFDPADRLVNVTYMIKRGPPVFFDQVKIAGNVKTRDKVIRRELEVAEKGRFSSAKIRESRNALLRTGFFKDVTVSTEKTEKEDQVDLLVKVEEAPTGTFSVGAGYSTASAFSFRTSLEERNLFGTGRRGSANLLLSKTDQDIVLGLVEPRVLDSRADLGFDVFHTTAEYASWTNRRSGFATRISAPLRYVRLPYFGRRADVHGVVGPEAEPGFSILDHLHGGIGYTLFDSKITDVEADAPSSIEAGKSLTSAITPRLSYDTRNHFFVPTQGTRSVMSVKLAGLGGDNRFMRSDASLSWYYPIFRNFEWGENFAVMLGGRIGYGATWTDRELPLFERYFAGGINSVRGFEYRTLGPRECPRDDPGCDDPETIGGNKQLILKTELHFPILDQWGFRGSMFLDQGQAFGPSQNIRLEDLKRALGLAMQWQSPIGPIKLSWAFPLNADPSDRKEVLGFAFGAVGGL